jgi:hypothetical protein
VAPVVVVVVVVVLLLLILLLVVVVERAAIVVSMNEKDHNCDVSGVLSKDTSLFSKSIHFGRQKWPTRVDFPFLSTLLRESSFGIEL